MTHEAMPNHEWHCFPLLLGKCQTLCRKLTNSDAVERHKICHPVAVEDGERQQRVFGRLSQRFSLLDQQTCPLCRHFRLWSCVAFDMNEWGYERDLKIDLLAAQRRRGR